MIATTKDMSGSRRTSAHVSNLGFFLVLPPLLLIDSSVNAFRSYRYVDFLNSGEAESDQVVESEGIDVVTDFLEQPLDHFDFEWSKRINATLRQRFFYSDRHVDDGPNLPTFAFLCVGGEGPALNARVLIDSVHCSGDMLELA